MMPTRGEEGFGFVFFIVVLEGAEAPLLLVWDSCDSLPGHKGPGYFDS